MNQSKPPPRDSRRMPKDSAFYDKVVPILIVGLGVVTLALMLVAAGVLLGVVSWR